MSWANRSLHREAKVAKGKKAKKKKTRTLLRNMKAGHNGKKPNEIVVYRI